MIQEFKTYMDLTEANCNPKYALKMEEWERSHPEVKQRLKLDIPSSNRDHGSQPDGKRSVTCYHCGKAGHMSRDCRIRLATEKQAIPSQSLSVTHTQQQPTATRGERKPIVCFNCQQVGHKSPNCPKKAPTVKKIQIPMNRVVALKPNEVFGTVKCHFISIILVILGRRLLWFQKSVWEQTS